MNTNYSEIVRKLHCERTAFRIISRPVKITFVCPYCEVSQEIDWKDLNVPEYWGDDWGEVKCPDCGKILELGEYDYD